MNIKQNMRIKIQQMSKYIFLNQTFQVLTDCLFWFLQTQMILLKGIKPKGITYQKVLLRIITSSPVEKLLWPNHRFWYKTIWRNKKVNNRASWRLQYRMFVLLWLRQKTLKTTSGWSDQPKGIKCWFRNNSACWSKRQFTGQLKKLDYNDNAKMQGEMKQMFS